MADFGCRASTVHDSRRVRANLPHDRDVQRTMRLLTHAVTAVAMIGVAAAAPLAAHAQPAGPNDFSYNTAIAAGEKAEAAHNESEARDDFIRALALVKGHPDVIFLIARTEARLGHADAAVARLRTIAAMGLAYPIEDDSAFATLRGQKDFEVVRSAMDANRSAISTATVAHALTDTNMLAEDLAYDPESHTFYVSSIHRGAIVAVPESGPAREFVPAGRDNVFGIMALGIDVHHGVLWATTSAMPQADRYKSADAGRSAVLRYELSTGRLLARFDAPHDGRSHNLGDMTVDQNGAVIVSDGTSGDVYTIRAGHDSLETLVARGTFQSPQTPAVLPDGRVMVADYALGLALIDRQDGTVTWVQHPDTIAVNGIDGMYLQGHSLYAIQNGTSPERVVRFSLDSRFAAVTGWKVIERGSPGLGDPTHGVLLPDGFYFLGNSGWDRFADNGSIKPGNASPPTILHAPLAP
jgi:hypothetical protein